MCHSYRNTCAKHSNFVLILCEYFNSPPMFSSLNSTMGWSVLFFLHLHRLPKRPGLNSVGTSDPCSVPRDLLARSRLGRQPRGMAFDARRARLKCPSWATQRQHECFAASDRSKNQGYHTDDFFCHHMKDVKCNRRVPYFKMAASMLYMYA